ncbi:MAG: galactose mutarotase [Oscillospiraceae bacterium]|jgi:aldose 1-epimerase|nr:galactose mutarotase [Oscillospiraceae bacterium]
MNVKTEWGFADGYKCYLIALRNKNGMEVLFTNYGAAVVGLNVPDKNGEFSDVVLGYDCLYGYVDGVSCQGAVMGRFANRIAGGRFALNGKTYELYKNDGDNCLHGGQTNFGKRVWGVRGISDGENPGVTFRYVSPDGEENFPAEAEITARYTVTARNSLKIEYSAVSDGDTVLNLTNHAYFNLGGVNSGDDILDTELQLFASSYTPFSEANVPTGETAPVKGTAFDFTAPKLIGADIISGKIGGYDHNYILGEPGVTRKIAVAYHEKSGRKMTVYTDMPAVQFYTALHLDEKGKGGARFGKFAGFSLETQFTPNTPNLPDFPSCVLKKGEEFRSVTEYVFSADCAGFRPLSD